MENTDINSIDIILLILAVIFLVLWVVNLVKLYSARATVRRRNAFIWSQRQEVWRLRSLVRSEQTARQHAEEELESARAANDALTGKPVDSGTVSAPDRDLRTQLDEAMQVSHRYLRSNFGKDDVADLLHVEKKDVDQLFKDASLSDYIARWRMEYAIGRMQEDPEKSIAFIAGECGFSGERAMDKASRQVVGMSVEELREAMKL